MNNRLQFPAFFLSISILLTCFLCTIALAQDPSSQKTTPQKSTPTYAQEDLQALKLFTTNMRKELRTLEQSSATSRPHSIDEAFRAVPSPKTPGNIFRWVVDTISFEPYAGALRGPTGTLIAGSANSVDQALLLNALMQKAGHKTRFVQGTMHEHDLSQTLLGFTGSARLNAPKNTDLLKDFTPEDLTTRTQYTQLLSTHLWLEVQQPDGQYLPADPILAPLFGMTPAVATSRSQTLPKAFQANIELQLVARLKDEQENTLLTAAAPLEQYAYRTLSLGFTPDEIQKNAVRPILSIDKKTPTKPGQTFPADQLATLELRYTMKIGHRESRWTQTLYQNTATTQPNPAPAKTLDFSQQHFAISFIPGWTANDQLTRLSHQSLSLATAQLNQITPKNPNPQQTIHNAIEELAPLIHFTYLRNLDRLTFDLSNLTGVRLILQSPRVVTTAISPQNDNLAITLNLHGDTLETIPMIGVPTAAATGLLTLYGRIKNQLESELLTTQPPSNATSIDRIFRQARHDKIPFATLHSASPEFFKQLQITPQTRAQLEELTNQRGMILLAPTRPVTLQNLPYFGWWTLQPQNGALSGHNPNPLFVPHATNPTPSQQLQATLNLSTRLHARLQQTLDHPTQRPLICQARTDVHRLSTAFCATTSRQKLPTLKSCLSTKPATPDNNLITADGLLAFAAPSCEQQLKETRCGTVITAAFLDGTLNLAAPEIPPASPTDTPPELSPELSEKAPETIAQTTPIQHPPFCP